VLGVEPDYILYFRALISSEFGTHTPTRGVGGISPPTIAIGGSRRMVVSPKGFFYEKYL